MIDGSGLQRGPQERLCWGPMRSALLVPLLLLADAGPARTAVEIIERHAAGLRIAYEAEPTAVSGTSVLVGIPPTEAVSLVVTEARAGEPLPVGADASCGREPARLRVAGWVRGQRVAQLVFGCRQLADGSQVPYERVVVDLRFTPPPGPAAAVRPDRWSEALLGDLLVNGEQARGWRRPPPRGARKASRGARPQAPVERWRIAVREEGIYRIDYGELQRAGLMQESTPSTQFRLYYGGGQALSRNEPAGPHGLREVALVVEDGRDGSVDEGDFLLFYGESVNRWEYDFDRGAFRYRKNLYTRDNTYFLDVDPEGGGKRAEVRSGAPTADSPLQPAGYRERLHAEEENTILVRIAGQSSGYDWYWEDFRHNARNFPVEIQDALDEPVTIRLAFFGVSLSSHRFQVRWNDRTVGALEFDGPAASRHEIETDESPRDGTNLLGLVHQSERTVRLDWYEIEYSRRFVARDGELRFTGPSHDGPVEFRLHGFESGSARVFEVSADLAEIVDVVWEGDVALFQDRAAGSPRRYVAAEQERWQRPVRIERAAVGGLADPAGAAEYLVISHAEFMAPAVRLAEWRARDDRFGPPLVARAVDVQAVYDEFSGGLLDPAAIRNFVHFAYENWEPAPFFVTLLGDGTDDYKDNSGLNRGNWIPAFQDGASTYDEWYVRVSGSDPLPDLAVGRLPVTSRAEAAAVVDKLVAYDSTPEVGPWQTRILLVADDLRNPDHPGIRDSEFLLDAESMVLESLPDDLDLRKLYLADFSLEGRRKPKARDEFIRLFNEGALLVTYLGHGNPDVLAHEHMFVLSRDQDDIANDGRLPLLFTAASQVGPFDRLSGQTIPEVFINRAEGGAVGVISATRIGYHPSNMKLANQFHQRLFRSGRAHVPVGVALMEAKQLVEAGLSERRIMQRYSLFGDPATYLARPRFQIELHVADTLQALEEVRVTGRVLDGQGRVASSYSGVAEIQVFDSAAPGRLDDIPYEQLGGTLFRGRTPVAEGRLEARFLVPKDITYRADKGRISAYAWSPTSPAAFGRVDDVVLSGTAAGVVPDEAGPQVRIGFRGQPDFESGDGVGQRPVMVVSFSDPSGINVTGSIGHEIELLLNGRTFPLTRLYNPNEGSYQEGTLEFELPELEVGEHGLSLRAWDNYNNTTQETVRFHVEPAETVIVGLRLYPNPVKTVGYLTFEIDADIERVHVQLFTLAGRLVDEFEEDGTRGYHQLEWSPAAVLASGTYLCRVAVLDHAGVRATETIAAVVIR